jgi:hypothetical protein
MQGQRRKLLLAVAGDFEIAGPAHSLLPDREGQEKQGSFYWMS